MRLRRMYWTLVWQCDLGSKRLLACNRDWSVPFAGTELKNFHIPSWDCTPTGGHHSQTLLPLGLWPLDRLIPSFLTVDFKHWFYVGCMLCSWTEFTWATSSAWSSAWQTMARCYSQTQRYQRRFLSLYSCCWSLYLSRFFSSLSSSSAADTFAGVQSTRYLCSMGSWQRGQGQREQLPFLSEILACGKLSFLNFVFKVQHFCWIFHILGKFVRKKMKFPAPIDKLQLSVGKLHLSTPPAFVSTTLLMAIEN